MAEKQTFTYYLTIDVEAMNEDSAMKKLEGVGRTYFSS